MSVLLKRLLIALGITIILVGGYILWTQMDTSGIEATSEDIVYQRAKSEEVFEYSRQLNRIQLETDVLNDVRFESLESIEVDLEDVPTGRDNPFTDTR